MRRLLPLGCALGCLAFAATDVAANSSPKITGLEIVESEAGGDAPGWRADVETRDPDGDTVEIEYRWFVNGKPSPQQGAEFDTAVLARGDSVYVEVVATDGYGKSRPTRSGVIAIANAAPEITSVPSGLSKAGTFSYQIETMDVDGDESFKFTLVRAPAGMTVTQNGELAWTPTSSQAGDHTVIVTVSDRRGGLATQEFVLPVRRGDGAQAPASAQ